jgi:hypothetical protein
MPRGIQAQPGCHMPFTLLSTNLPSRIALSKCRTFAVVSFLALLFDVDARSADIDISLSDRTAIEDAQVISRDRSKPFYFHLNQPSSPSRQDQYTFVADIGTEFKVWLDKLSLGVRATDTRSRALAFQITADTESNVKDKIVLNVVKTNGPEHFDLNAADTTHFLSFDFMLDRTYQAPHFWLLHMQVWQCCGGVPPFAIHVAPTRNPSAPIELLFCVQDDSYRSVEHAGEPGRIIYRMIATREQWNTMVLALTPGTDETPSIGGVTMWLNKKLMFSWKGPWGFRPTVNGERGTSMGVDIGIYRRRQMGMQTIFFDNIRYGSTYNSVTSDNAK